MRFLGILFLAAACLCPGQPPSLNPAPVRATLKRIIEILDRYPKSPGTGELVAGMRQRASWLAGQLRDDRTPAQYGRSVERDLALLRAALDLAPDAQAETLRSVSEDISLKHADCKRFGMARLVKLEVRTMHGTAETKGWQVLYRWLPGRAVGEVRSQSFPALSSPAAVELPPGAYSVRAVKNVEGRELSSKEWPVPVGGAKTVAFEVPVP